jgi:hypothetical protein
MEQEYESIYKNFIKGKIMGSTPRPQLEEGNLENQADFTSTDPIFGVQT